MLDMFLEAFTGQKVNFVAIPCPVGMYPNVAAQAAIQPVCA